MLHRYFIALMIISMYGCSEEKIGPNVQDNTPPKPLTHITAENMSGAVRITYQLPDDPDLLYVAAEYLTRNATPRVFKSSFFNNHILVEGFADAGEYDVKLYAVDRSGNRSEPTTIQVAPLRPPVVEAFNSLTVFEDFGGISLSFVNEAEADIGIAVLVLDQNKERVLLDTYYTARREGIFSLRGLSAQSRTFGFLVSDKWENTSDTLWRELTPLFEEELDKGKFNELYLPTDAGVYNNNGPRFLWDGSAEEPNFQRTASGDFPHHITFDLGVTAKLSRFVFWQRVRYQTTVLAYGNGNPRLFEVWGTDNPAADGSFTGWTKLMDCESIKPSGLPNGQVSNEDVEYASRGEEFIFPFDTPPVRYIRIRFLNTWGNTNFAHIAETNFYGQVVD